MEVLLRLCLHVMTETEAHAMIYRLLQAWWRVLLSISVFFQRKSYTSSKNWFTDAIHFQFHAHSTKKNIWKLSEVIAMPYATAWDHTSVLKMNEYGLCSTQSTYLWLINNAVSSSHYLTLNDLMFTSAFPWRNWGKLKKIHLESW